MKTELSKKGKSRIRSGQNYRISVPNYTTDYWQHYQDRDGDSDCDILLDERELLELIQKILKFRIPKDRKEFQELKQWFKELVA